MLPKEAVEEIYVSVEDDGIGMSVQEFSDRWMKLAYNRLRYQGEFAEFPQERSFIKRRAYGRNGVGRHSMLCFGNKYRVESWKNGTSNTFEIVPGGGENAFQATLLHSYLKAGHGTIVSARIDRNHPNVELIASILAARFMFDPQFKLYINDRQISLEEFGGIICEEEIIVSDDINLKIMALSSESTARRSQQHGIAFWVNRRLVGEPTWIINKKNLTDGRTTIAKQYTVIVQTDDLLSDITEDWTELKKNKRVSAVYDAVEDSTNKLFKDLGKEKREDLKKHVVRRFVGEIQKMDYSKRREILELVDQMVENLQNYQKVISKQLCRS